MRSSKTLIGWFAALAVAGLLVARPCAAQEGVQQEEAKSAAASSESHPPAGSHPGESAGPNPLAFDPDLALFTLIVFLILFGVLSVFAWPQISAALVERERKIEEQIAAATAKNEEAKRLLAEHEARLAAAAGEVRGLLDEARRDAEHTRKRIEQEGHQAAQDELARAIREIERAKDGAIEELAKSTANVAVEMARRVVQERITPDEHSALVRSALDRLAAVANPSKN
jgi:F-type H+-transporting ATPase subunit b